MAAGQGVEGYIELTDFSQGIQTSWRSGLKNAQDGAAQITDTWACVANPAGGLEAGPRKVATLVGSLAGGTSASLNAAHPTAVRIHDILALPGYDNNSWYNSSYYNREPDVLYAAVEYFFNSGGSPRVSQAMVEYNQPSTVFTRWVDTDSNAPVHNHYGTGSVAAVRTAAAKAALPVGAELGSPFANSLLSGAIETSPQFTVPAVQLGRFIGGAPTTYTGNTVLRHDPTSTTMGTTAPGSPFYMPNQLTTTQTRIFTHQGRAAWTTLLGVQPGGIAVSYGDTYGANGGYSGVTPFADDVIKFHEVGAIQDYNLLNTFSMDSRVPDQCGAVASMNMNDLFIVKAQRGGVIVRGPLEAPQIITVPGVVPTGPYPHQPCVTNIGLVYGTPFGVFSWNGGQVSQLISPGLEGAFWLPPGNGRDVRHPLTPVGRFAYQYPYIYAPYNWVMDARTGGWFRAHPTAAQDVTNGRDIGLWTVGSFGKVYGSQLNVPRSGTGSNEMATTFDPTLGAFKYSWRSQPLVRTQNRLVKFREINLVCIGSGTVTVTLHGLNTSKSVPFTVSSTKPKIYTQPVSVDAHDVEIQFVSDGGGSQAPSILRASFGFQGTATVS